MQANASRFFFLAAAIRLLQLIDQNPTMVATLTIGSRRQVFNGTAKHTAGNLFKADLKQTSDGRIRSRRASAAAKKKLQHNPAFKKYVQIAKAQKGKRFKRMTKLKTTGRRRKAGGRRRRH